GSTATNTTGTVTLTFANDAGGNAPLTLSGSLSNGAVTFSVTTLANFGLGYTLRTTLSGLTSAVSSPVNVAANRLVITTQPPATVTAGSPFSFVVAAEDSLGNIDTN